MCTYYLIELKLPTNQHTVGFENQYKDVHHRIITSEICEEKKNFQYSSLHLVLEHKLQWPVRLDQIVIVVRVDFRQWDVVGVYEVVHGLHQAHILPRIIIENHQSARLHLGVIILQKYNDVK